MSCVSSWFQRSSRNHIDGPPLASKRTRSTGRTSEMVGSGCPYHLVISEICGGITHDRYHSKYKTDTIWQPNKSWWLISSIEPAPKMNWPTGFVLKDRKMLNLNLFSRSGICLIWLFVEKCSLKSAWNFIHVKLYKACDKVVGWLWLFCLF